MAAVLTDAFAGDAAIAATLPEQGAHRDRRLRRFFAQEVARSTGLGGAWTTADGDAAAVWYPPGRWEPGAWEVLRRLPGSLWTFRGHVGRASRIVTTLREHHPREPHWYLAYLGARPDRQGAGLGSALVRAVLQQCDRAGLPAYLEASNERNRRLYRRLGFTEREPLPLPGDGPTLFPMWRPAAR
jgi:GNAT superfamily N-acetyltransferase